MMTNDVHELLALLERTGSEQPQQRRFTAPWVTHLVASPPPLQKINQGRGHEQ